MFNLENSTKLKDSRKEYNLNKGLDAYKKSLSLLKGFFSSGEQDRTADLRVMNPTL